MVAVNASGNTTIGTNCLDPSTGGGYVHNQQTSSSATYSTSPNTIATGNAASLMVGAISNNCGGITYTAGNDGQGHSYILRRQDGSTVTGIETLSETSTGSYLANLTGSGNCQNNAEAVAIK